LTVRAYWRIFSCATIIAIVKTKTLPLFSRFMTAVAALLTIFAPASTRAQADIPIYLPVILKPLAMVAPEWVWTSDCAKTSNFEGSTPDGGTIGQVARKLAFVGLIPGGERQPYTYQWVINGNANVLGGPRSGTVDADGTVASGVIIFGRFGACQDPQPPGVYEMRITLAGRPFYTAQLTITP
jgi:hypothetical protein